MDIGAQLRRAREAQGLSLDSVAEKTRVQTRFLEAIERNDLSSIPPKPFGRGFVRAYALEVGLDPDQTVSDYFAQFPPVIREQPAWKVPYESPRRPAWLVPLVSVAVLVTLIASAKRGGEPSTDTAAAADVVGTAGTDLPHTARSESSGPAAGAPSSLKTDRKPDTSGLNVVLTVTAESWVTATSDGNRVVYRLLAAGTRESLRATREITVLAGNAGGVDLTVNGRPAGPLGQSGEVRTIRIAADSAGNIGRANTSFR
jgi:cytoskeletal protein RodZ